MTVSEWSIDVVGTGRDLFYAEQENSESQSYRLHKKDELFATCRLVPQETSGESRCYMYSLGKKEVIPTNGHVEYLQGLVFTAIAMESDHKLRFSTDDIPEESRKV